MDPLVDARVVPVPVELRRHLWVWAATVPWLPDVLADADHASLSGDILAELDASYQALVEAVATAAPPGSALQLRIGCAGWAAGHSSSAPALLEVTLCGSARSEAESAQLAQLVTTGFPHLVPLDPVPARQLREHLQHVDLDAVDSSGIAEIRRRVESIDPVLESEPGAGNPLAPVVLPWTPAPHALRAALAGMRRHPARSVICVHIQPARPSRELVDHLDGTLLELAASQRSVSNPTAAEVVTAYRRRLRTLPRAAVVLRVLVVAEGRLPPGIPEAIGVDLAASGFDVVRPRNAQEAGLATDLLESFTAHGWQRHELPEIAELLALADPGEAAAIFRLPTAPRGGLPGLPVARLSTLPRSPQPRSDSRSGVIGLGIAPGGGYVDISLQEVNQHLLVAGLPGFGKSTSVQTLLSGLVLDHDIPFLVIDPAKSDYTQLIGHLAQRGGRAGRARRVVLDAETPAFNPFAVPEGCGLGAHAGRVLAAFDAALGLSGVWPTGYVTLGRALFAAYERCGPGTAPTLRSLYAALGDVIRRSGFTGPDGTNARAALLGRIEFLARGPLGAALTSDSSGGIDWAELTSVPTVVELRNFAGPVERSLVFALLLAGLVSYREANPTPGRLSHVTVLEEAHRVLGTGTSGAAGVEGLRLMVEAVAELRGSGEGFVIVEQAPSTLHPSVPKVTGSLLCHRVVEADERRVLGEALLLDERQRDDLARLPRGRAVLYSGQRISSLLVDIEPVVDPAGPPAAATHRTLAEAAADPMLCVGCRAMCRYEDQGRALATSLDTSGVARELVGTALRVADDNPALARCAVAHALAGDSERAGRPAVLLPALMRLDDELVRAAAATRQGDAGE